MESSSLSGIFATETQTNRYLVAEIIKGEVKLGSLAFFHI